MPAGYVPQSQDDKTWKLATERELTALRREVDLLKRQLAELLRRR